ncbi:MAG: ATP-binding protein [Pseudomonadota bacterium]
MNGAPNGRILLIDDLPAIHDDFRKILATPEATPGLDLAEAALFGTPAANAGLGYTLDSAYQGQQGVELVARARAAGRPYALAFIDMRMPPGWDGVETVERLWQADPHVQVVICTAYSDHAWTGVLARLDGRDRLLVLKKPFDVIEVCQLANTLTAKWNLAVAATRKLERLEETVAARARDILRANAALETEIRERKLLESQLVQTEKLASLGQLAAGVAHEINNPIGYVFSNFGTLEEYLAILLGALDGYERIAGDVREPAVARQLAELRQRVELDYLKQDIPQLMRESKEGVSRVRKIVQDLKDFSRVESEQRWELADLHAGIDSTLNIVASEVKYCADVVKEYGALPLVECLPSQINQVVLNLVVNAAHACGPARGKITIRTGLGSAGSVWFEVADTGCGVADDVLPRIFDPFFTTKPIGKGTGLGLSMCYGIVKKHDGDIAVRSTVGQGSTFRVTLPERQVGPDGPAA